MIQFRQAFPALVPALLAAALLAGCAQPTRPRANAATTAACRVEVDRVYSAQNRVDLSTRDNRDSPFASSYLPGITSRGLGAEYGRDNMVQSCLNNAAGGAGPAAPTPSTGPAFTTTPTSR